MQAARRVSLAADHVASTSRHVSRVRFMSTPPTAPSLEPGPPTPLSWPEYLKIRSLKRRWELATTIPSTIGGFTGGLSYFGSIEADPTSTIMGVEPVWVYAAATIGCAGAGYLIGPLIGASFWRMTHRRALARIEARDKEFYQHIVKNRVDPSRQSATNPVPDYYGENIGSLKQYRQWLRDQARYRRKSAWPEEM